MSDSLTIQAQAKRFENLRLSDNIHELLPGVNTEVEIILFHGLQRPDSEPQHAFWRTWKTRDSEECWLETLLPKRLNVGGRQYRARVLSISYEGRPDLGKDGKGTAASDEYLIAENLYQQLILNANVGQNGAPVFLLGHDLGGILIKKLVIMVKEKAARTLDETERGKLSKFLENLKWVFFYATPHYGSDVFERMAAKLKEKDANQMLRLMKVLHYETSRINDAFQKIRRQHRISTYGIYATHETNEGGFNVQVVSEASTRTGMDYLLPISANHFTVCQPEGATSSAVQILAGKILDEIENMRSSRNRSQQNGRRREPAEHRSSHGRTA